MLCNASGRNYADEVFLDIICKIKYYHSCVKNTQAAVAQSVVRRIGSAEVTGSIPVSSFSFFVVLYFLHEFCKKIVHSTIYCGILIMFNYEIVYIIR